MNARSQVECLLGIIKEAAYGALEQYEKSGMSTPTLESTDPHPLDSADDNLQLKKIISKLEGACGQLCSMLAPPSHTVMNRAQDFGWACLRVAITRNIADALKEYPNGLHVEELSKRTNVHPLKLASILRVLATKHCFREVAPNIFSNNRLSVNLTSDQPLSALIDLVTEEGQVTAAVLSDYVVDEKRGQSLAMSDAAFQYRNKDKEPVEGSTFYDWMQSAENQERRKVMMKAMASMNTTIGSLAALHVYPWKDITTVCDVGSGMGSFARSLLEADPNVHVTQFDLPETVAGAKNQWKDDFADRNIFVAGDFLNEIPVKNCDVYYLRNIIHNWRDEKALVIMKSVRAAMGKHSRVLIHDHVLRHISSTHSVGDTAPDPMLPNYGAGNIRLYHQDLTMMMMYNANERTVTEMITIGKDAGLTPLNVYDLVEMCLIEFGVAEE